VSHPHRSASGDTRSALVATLGSDFQAAVAPFKAEILEVATHLQGDVHRAAMRLLIDRRGRRPTVMEQQLIVAALAELQDAAAPASVLSRVAVQLDLFSRMAPPPRRERRADPGRPAAVEPGMLTPPA
jgi:hypothetical protein